MSPVPLRHSPFEVLSLAPCCVALSPSLNLSPSVSLRLTESDSVRAFLGAGVLLVHLAVIAPLRLTDALALSLSLSLFCSMRRHLLASNSWRPYSISVSLVGCLRSLKPLTVVSFAASGRCVRFLTTCLCFAALSLLLCGCSAVC